MDALLIVALVATGLAAGLIGGLLGIGGCSIMLPVLIFAYNYPEPIAIGTTITAVILTAASGAIAHLRLRNIDKNTVVVVGVSGAIGATAGDLLFDILATKIWALDIVLGSAFIYTALRMAFEGVKGFYRSLTTSEKISVGASHRSLSPSSGIPGALWLKAVIGFGVGVIAGVLGLGGGYVLVPVFIYLLGAPVKLAVGTSLPSFLPLAIVSAIPKLVAGNASLLAALVLGIGTIVGAQLGAKLVPHAPTWLIKLLFGAIFAVVSIKFILKGLTILGVI